MCLSFVFILPPKHLNKLLALNKTSFQDQLAM